MLTYRVCLKHWLKNTILKNALIPSYPIFRHISYIDMMVIPVVPHKAVAEVSKIRHYRRGELL